MGFYILSVYFRFQRQTYDGCGLTVGWIASGMG